MRLRYGEYKEKIAEHRYRKLMNDRNGTEGRGGGGEVGSRDEVKLSSTDYLLAAAAAGM